MTPQEKDPVGFEIARLLKEAFESSTITEPQIAETTGIPQQSINRVVSKGQATNITRTRSIARALGLDYMLLEAQAITAVESVAIGTKESFGLVAHATPDIEAEQEATEANQP